MEILEKDLEDMIYEAAKTYEGKNFLARRGLFIDGQVLRQVKIGDYGIADLISVNYSGRRASTVEDKKVMVRWFHIDLIELKRGPIDILTLLQAHRYLAGIKHFVNGFDVQNRLGFTVQIHLIGSTFDQSSDLVFLLNQLKSVNIYTFHFNYDGIHFKRMPSEGWHLETRPKKHPIAFPLVKQMIQDSYYYQYKETFQAEDDLPF